LLSLIVARWCVVHRPRCWQGRTAQEIARALSLSAGTVRNYLSRILAKAGARSRIDAILKAQNAGWI
jgi:two-component system response regulator DesR